MVRYSIQTMLRCVKRWKQSPRMIVLFAMLGCIILIYALPFVENARVQNEKLQIGEVFVALTNWRFSTLLFSCSILLLFCDLPIVDKFTVNAIIKGDRKSWLFGQMLYVIFTSVICASGVFFLSVAIALPDLSFSNLWSKPAKLIATSGRIAIDPARLKLSMNSYVVKNFSPYMALLHSYLLLILLNCFYGTAALIARMYVRSGSFIVLIAANAISWCASMFAVGEVGYVIFSSLSPNYHASLYSHANTALNSALPTLSHSYVCLLLMICLLYFLGTQKVKNFDFVLHEEVAE